MSLKGKHDIEEKEADCHNGRSDSTKYMICGTQKISILLNNCFINEKNE